MRPAPRRALAFAAALVAAAFLALPLIGGTVPPFFPAAALRQAASRPPDWAAVPRPGRTLTMDVTATGPATRLQVTVDYAVRVDGDDPLLERSVAGDEIGRFLAGGPVSTPVTVERTDPGGPAVLRFRYTGPADEYLSLGDADSLDTAAARTVERRLTIRTDPAVIVDTQPSPARLEPRLAVFTGVAEPVWVQIADDAVAPPPGSGLIVAYLHGAGRALGWLTALVAPWLVLLVATRGRSRFAVTARTAAPAAVALAAVSAATALVIPDLQFEGAVAVLLAAAAAAAVLPRRVLPPRVLLVAGGLLVPAVAVVVGAAVVLAGGSPHWWVPVASAAPVVVAVLAGRRFAGWRAGVAAAAAALLAAGAGTAFALFDLPRYVDLLAAAILAAAVGAAVAPRPARAAMLVAPLAIVPLAAVSGDWAGYLQTSDSTVLPLALLTRLATLALGVAALGFLRRAGARGSAVGLRVVAAAALAALLVVAVDPFPYGWPHALAVLSLVLAWWWLVPPRRRAGGARLARVGAEAHRELVRAETRRRLLEASAHELYRRARTRLGAEEGSLAAYDAAQRELDDAARERAPLPPFSTGGGGAPWPNAVRAAGYAAPIALALAGYEAFALIGPGYPRTTAGLALGDYVVVGAHLARWFVYALLFGYLYPALRGAGPQSKAAAFVVALLGVELLPILDLPTRAGGASSVLVPGSGTDLLAAAAIRIGQLVVFFGVLGLLWERWLTRAAGFPWSRVRNVRSVRALAAPVGTVLVGVLTAAGAALAGAAVAALLAAGAPAAGPGANDPGARPSAPAATP